MKIIGERELIACVKLCIDRELLTWKKEVWDGSSPVLPAGTDTELGATRPTRAGAPTLYLPISSRICSTPQMCLTQHLSLGSSSPSLDAYLIQVALGEDNTDVANQGVKKGGPLVTACALTVQADAAFHQGVLSHQHCAVRAQTLPGD